ncbi:estrogen receptor beta-like [Petaurus breviceps papuanus]|uniref:estrogen receptor beta-like n=1 Tax=Petaurus breviceps papuanus TaxID=3040969 RepID=UPI0036DD9176
MVEEEVEEIKKRWPEYIKELYKKDLNITDNHNDVVTDLEPYILKIEVKWTLGCIANSKASGGDGIPAELFKILKDDAVKEDSVLKSSQFGKLNSGHWIGKRSVYIEVLKKAMPGHVQVTEQLHSFHTSASSSIGSELLGPRLPVIREQYLRQASREAERSQGAQNKSPGESWTWNLFRYLGFDGGNRDPNRFGRNPDLIQDQETCKGVWKEFSSALLGVRIEKVYYYAITAGKSPLGDLLVFYVEGINMFPVIEGYNLGHNDYICPVTNQWTIDKNRCQSCQACRLWKCYEVGMMKCGSRRECCGYRVIRRQWKADEQICLSKAKQNSENVTRVKELLLNALSPEQFVLSLLEAEPPNVFVSHPNKPFTKASMVMSLTNLADKELVHMIGWAKKIPGMFPLTIATEEPENSRKLHHLLNAVTDALVWVIAKSGISFQQQALRLANLLMLLSHVRHASNKGMEHLLSMKCKNVVPVYDLLLEMLNAHMLRGYKKSPVTVSEYGPAEQSESKAMSSQNLLSQ